VTGVGLADHPLLPALDSRRSTTSANEASGNEVARVLENHITADGSTTVGLSIETYYRFKPDGSVVIRTERITLQQLAEGTSSLTTCRWISQPQRFRTASTALARPAAAK
jgi:hypothetical protein